MPITIIINRFLKLLQKFSKDENFYEFTEFNIGM